MELAYERMGKGAKKNRKNKSKIFVAISLILISCWLFYAVYKNIVSNVNSETNVNGKINASAECFVGQNFTINPLYSCYLDKTKELALEISGKTEYTNLLGFRVVVSSRDKQRSKIFNIKNAYPDKDIRMYWKEYNQTLEAPKHVEEKWYVLNLTDFNNPAELSIAAILLTDKERICKVSSRINVVSCESNTTSKSVYWGSQTYAAVEYPEKIGECENDTGCEVGGCYGGCMAKQNIPKYIICPAAFSGMKKVPNSVCKCVNTVCVWYNK